eukprot:4832834-Pyramimonas_sp.AAC.1
MPAGPERAHVRLPRPGVRWASAERWTLSERGWTLSERGWTLSEGGWTLSERGARPGRCGRASLARRWRRAPPATPARGTCGRCRPEASTCWSSASCSATSRTPCSARR